MLEKFKSLNKQKKIILIFIVLLFVIFSTKLVLIYSKKVNSTFDLREEVIIYDNLPSSFNNYKILQLADLHSKEFGPSNEDLIQSIKDIDPDIIMVTGDMFTVTDMGFGYGEKDLVAYKLLTKLAKDYKILYILGNHEEGKDILHNGEISDYRNRKNDNPINRYINGLVESGVTFIDNRKITINPLGDIVFNSREESIDIYGLYDSSFNIKDDFFKNLKGNPDRFEILLCHNPLIFNYISDKQFDLTLSGHVHGGVIRLPIVGGVLSPERKLFPKFDKGIYTNDNYNINVSSGLGDTRIERINNKPELNIITLKNK